jgi:hypothetical protein
VSSADNQRPGRRIRTTAVRCRFHRVIGEIQVCSRLAANGSDVSWWNEPKRLSAWTRDARS